MRIRHAVVLTKRPVVSPNGLVTVGVGAAAVAVAVALTAGGGVGAVVSAVAVGSGPLVLVTRATVAASRLPAWLADSKAASP